MTYRTIEPCPCCSQPMSQITIWNPQQTIQEAYCRNKECELYSFDGLKPFVVPTVRQLGWLA